MTTNSFFFYPFLFTRVALKQLLSRKKLPTYQTKEIPKQKLDSLRKSFIWEPVAEAESLVDTVLFSARIKISFCGVLDIDVIFPSYEK